MQRIREAKQEGRTKEKGITKHNNGATTVGRWMVKERDANREGEGRRKTERRVREGKGRVGQKTKMVRERKKENVGLRAFQVQEKH